MKDITAGSRATSLDAAFARRLARLIRAGRGDRDDRANPADCANPADRGGNAIRAVTGQCDARPRPDDPAKNDR